MQKQVKRHVVTKLAAANGRGECASVRQRKKICYREGECYTKGKSKTSNSIDRLKISFFTLIAATRFAPWIVTLTLFLCASAAVRSCPRRDLYSNASRTSRAMLRKPPWRLRAPQSTGAASRWVCQVQSEQVCLGAGTQVLESGAGGGRQAQ